MEQKDLHEMPSINATPDSSILHSQKDQAETGGELAIISHNTKLTKGEENLTDAKEGEENPQKPKLYIRRWFQLLIFAICMTVGPACTATFFSAGTLMMKYYHLGENQNWKINIGSFLSKPFAIPVSIAVSYVLKNFGLRVSISIFAILTTVGAWIKVVGIQGSESSYWISFVGHMVMLAGLPFANQTSDLLGMLWFGNNERTFLMSVVIASGAVGSIIGITVSTRVMTIGSESAEDLKFSTLGVSIFLLSQAVFVTLSGILAIIFFKNKPPTPPVSAPEKKENSLTESLLSEEESVTEKEVEQSQEVYPPQTLMFGLKTLLRMPSYFMVLGAYSMYTCASEAISILEQIIKVNKYTAIDAGNYSIILVVFGTISSFVFSFLFDRTKQFKLITIISSLSGTLGFMWFCILMLWPKDDGTQILTGIAFVFIGAFNGPTPALLNQMIVYITYPVHPSTTMLVTILFSTCCSALMMIFTNVLQATTPLAPTIILWTALGLFVCACILIIAQRGKFSPVLLR